jgi:hypothetical protein
MKHVVVISFTDLARDPRVNRQIRWLAPHFRVTAVGLRSPEVEGVDFVPIEWAAKGGAARLAAAGSLLTRRFEAYYWNNDRVRHCLERLRGLRPDLVVANDLDVLPLALRVAQGGKVIFDAHEYAPLEFEDRLVFRLFYQRYRMYLCRRYVPQVHAMTTVCRSIADAYERDTGVRPAVVMNAPDYEDLEPAVRDASEPRIRLVHHGAAIRSRRIENMVWMMDHLDEWFELDFLLPTPTPADEAYVAELREMAKGKRIRFLDAVPMRELPRFLNRYDVGVFLLEPTNFNYRFALPNKLFEFIQARLAVAVGPSPEMARVVQERDCGVVARDFTPRAMAESLRRLDHARIAHHKRRAHEAARELCAEQSRVRMLELVEGAVAGQGLRGSARIGS